MHAPWLVAVWPGMGNVALTAGYYLMSKLGMHQLGEFSAEELFDVEHVEVKGGLIRTGTLPRSRLFSWSDPEGRHDLVLFIGEAQPPRGRYAFCRRLVERAQELGVERVFTFAAMATPMHPEHEARVFGAATDEEGLAEIRRLELDVLDDGQIGGLNGVLLGAAADAGQRGTCLLGEMPHIFTQLPFPRASRAVLGAFVTMAGIEIDFVELDEQTQATDEQLGRILSQVEHAMEDRMHAREAPEEPAEEAWAAAPEEGLSAKDAQRIERLFEEAARNLGKAYELKRELDRLEAFDDYEDRFLDLFKKPT